MQTKLIAVLLSLLLSPSLLHADRQAPVISPPPAAMAGKINLNTANISDLLHAVKGIGKKRAEAIIKYRTNNNGFKSLDELSNVPGIGKAFVKRNHVQLEKTFTVIVK